MVYQPTLPMVSGALVKFQADRLPISAAAGCLPFSSSPSALERLMFKKLVEFDVSLVVTYKFEYVMCFNTDSPFCFTIAFI